MNLFILENRNSKIRKIITNFCVEISYNVFISNLNPKMYYILLEKIRLCYKQNTIQNRIFCINSIRDGYDLEIIGENDIEQIDLDNRIYLLKIKKSQCF